MEHVVFYPSADGTPAFRRVPSLQDAVNFVEHLRNSEGVTEFSVHALAEVPLSFRPYYHVEVSGAEGASVAAEPAGMAAPPATPAVEPMPTPVAAAPADPAAEVRVPAQAPVAEVAEAPVPVAASTPFAEAPPVKAPAAVEAMAAEAPGTLEAPVADAPLGDTQEVVPATPGRRSMGFFARS
jgi:hypothetical protein